MTTHDRIDRADIIDLNLDELDVEALEQRLELATAHLDDAWDECTSCGNLMTCGTFESDNCPSLTQCSTYGGCKPAE